MTRAIPFLETQADRVVRIGQEQDVFVYTLFNPDTVEEILKTRRPHSMRLWIGSRSAN